MSENSIPRYKRRKLEIQDGTTNQEDATGAHKVPRTTRWNPDILRGRLPKNGSSRDPRIRIESDETPVEGRRWYSRAVRTKQTRAVCWRSASLQLLDSLEDYTPSDNIVHCTVCRVNCETSPQHRRSLPFSEWLTSGNLPQKPCHYCFQIANGASILAKAFDIDPEEFHMATMKVRTLENRTKLEIEVVIFWVAPDGDKTEHLIFTTDSASEFKQYTEVAHKVDGDKSLHSAALTSAFAAAESLLVTCRTQHDCCRSKSNFMPARLLELVTTDGNEQIRIVETSSVQQVEYAALSYCWGKMPFLRLQKELQAEMAISIAWETLPQLYKDVINFARRVKIHYLWIDALCIIQDCPADWERESALMGKIYHNAFVTIGATSCKDPTISLCGVQCEDFTVRLSRTQKKRFGDDLKFLLGRPRGGDLTWPLHYRAWTYQELLLSTRFLDFDSSAIKLHCKAGTLEKDQRGDTINSSSKDFRLPWAFRRSWAELFSVIDEPEVRKAFDDDSDEENVTISTTEAWHEVVMMYTNRQISYDTDILPALSGLAAEYLAKGGAEESYHAGLWKKTFLENLTWTVNDDVTPSIRYRAPSWSWASVLGSVDYREATHKWGISSFQHDSLRLLEVHCDVKGTNPFGEVLDGVAVLEGSTHSCTLGLDSRDRFFDRKNKTIKISGLDYHGPVTFEPDVQLRPFESVLEDGSKVRTALRQIRNPEGPAIEHGYDCDVVALRIHSYTPYTTEASAEVLFMILGFIRVGLCDEGPDCHQYERLGLLKATPKAEIEFVTRKLSIY